MINWMKNRGTIERIPAATAPRAVQEDHVSVGEYQLLYKYLRDRFANRIVLTFGEIEDLLGFALPTHAREQTWWLTSLPGESRSVQSRAWTLAGRTATVNLLARSVVFERDAA